MINLILAIVALLSVKVNGETRTCNANGGTCSCGGSVYAGTTCTLNCLTVDICKDSTLTCRAGDPCEIVCGATTACAGNTVIDASGATDVTITCSGVDSCKGSNVDITCGTGTCALECLTDTSCEDAVVDAGDAELLTCIEPAFCDRAVIPSYVPPLTTTTPTTTTAETSITAASNTATSTAAITATAITATAITATAITATAITATSITATSNATTLIFSQEECDALIAEHLSVSMSESVSDSPSDSASVDNSISLSFDSAEFTDDSTLAMIQQFLDFCGLECEMEYVGLVSGVDIGSLEVVTCDCDLVECKSAVQFGAAQRFASGRIIGFVLILMLFVLN